MVRKIRLTITTTDGADVVLAAVAKAQELVEDSPEACWWSDDYKSLGAALTKAFGEILDEGREIDAAVDAVCDEAEDVEYYGPDEVEGPEDLEQPWQLPLDLTATSDEGLALLRRLISRVGEARWFLVDSVQIGRQSAEPDDLLGIIDEHLEQREQHEEREQGARSSGSWGRGDFGGDPAPRSGTRLDPGPDETFWFYHEITRANLPLPRNADEAKQYFKRLTSDLHVDKHPGDPAANERFRRFKDGYEALRKRMGGV